MTATKLAVSNPAVNSNVRRDQFITENLHLVSAIASHVQRSVPVHIELDDLIHAGTMGLFDAATKYRDEKEVAFPTYAKHRIRGAILDSLRQQDWASRDLRKRYKQMESVTKELTESLGRVPTETEIAGAMGLNRKRWQALMVDFRSLNAAAVHSHQFEDDHQPAREIPATSTQTPEKLFARTELRGKLSTAMQALPAKYQQVVKLYYQNELSMKQIGAQLGVNESRVSQIHKSALERMQLELTSFGICSAAAFQN